MTSPEQRRLIEKEAYRRKQREDYFARPLSDSEIERLSRPENAVYHSYIAPLIEGKARQAKIDEEHAKKLDKHAAYCAEHDAWTALWWGPKWTEYVKADDDAYETFKAKHDALHAKYDAYYKTEGESIKQGIAALHQLYPYHVLEGWHQDYLDDRKRATNDEELKAADDRYDERTAPFKPLVETLGARTSKFNAALKDMHKDMVVLRISRETVSEVRRRKYDKAREDARPEYENAS